VDVNMQLGGVDKKKKGSDDKKLVKTTTTTTKQASTTTTTTQQQQPQLLTHNNSHSDLCAPSHNFDISPTSYRGTKMLPMLDASPLMNPTQYCRISGLKGGTASVNGADAAVRLLKGRNALMKTIHENLLHEIGHSKPFILKGHGMPSELLQDHIDLADTILSSHQHASTCSFKNVNGHLSFDWIRIRNTEGYHFSEPWPPAHADAASSKANDNLQHRMMLYLNVMSKLSSSLGLAIRATNLSELHMDSNSSSRSTTTTNDLLLEPRFWNAEFFRGIAYQSHLVPSSKNPIVEISQRGDGCYVHMTVQGMPTQNSSSEQLLERKRRKRAFPVTLNFDAYFSSSSVVDAEEEEE